MNQLGLRPTDIEICAAGSRKVRFPVFSVESPYHFAWYLSGTSGRSRAGRDPQGQRILVEPLGFDYSFKHPTADASNT